MNFISNITKSLVPKRSNTTSMWPPSDLEPTCHQLHHHPSSLRYMMNPSERRAARQPQHRETGEHIHINETLHNPLSHTVSPHRRLPTQSEWQSALHKLWIYMIWFYLPLSLSSFTMPPPPLPGFLQSSVFWMQLKLSSFLQVGCSVGHDLTFLPLSISKLFYFTKCWSFTLLIYIRPCLNCSYLKYLFNCCLKNV